MAECICKNCGTIAVPKTKTPGLSLVEIILWLCYIVPGLIYTIWRVCSRVKVCRECKSESIVGLDTPIGKKLASELIANDQK